MKTKNGFTLWAKQTCDSKIFSDKPDHWFKVWFYIVSNVNFKENGRFERGQGLFTYNELVSVLTPKKSRSVIDRIMRWLKTDDMLTTRKTTRGFIITVLNYDKYQNLSNYLDDNKKSNQTIGRRQVDDTIQKEGKKERIKNIYSDVESLTPEVIKEISTKYQVNTSFVEKQKQQLELYCESKGAKYKNYKATLMAWVLRKLDEAPKTARLKDLAPHQIEDLRLHPEKLSIYTKAGYDTSRINSKN